MPARKRKEKQSKARKTQTHVHKPFRTSGSLFAYDLHPSPPTYCPRTIGRLSRLAIQIAHSRRADIVDSISANPSSKNRAKCIHLVVLHTPLPQAKSNRDMFPYPPLDTTITHSLTRFRNRFGSRSKTRYRRLPRPLRSLLSDHDRRTWGSESEPEKGTSRALGELERGRVDVVSGWACIMLMRCGEVERMSRIVYFLRKGQRTVYRVCCCPVNVCMVDDRVGSADESRCETTRG